ncbi:hypothetical protein DFJ43DRAFT_1139323 [Lentinula guzmanii]|uniref:Homeobox domain-containing protein n=1 Tax=Lentinula guzmanii TaxID=2804957 RepID=A0AA38JG93_9AGAR|nr:hypothetical protein DFJ43DRAFT_1139323 [Lentinula guzmanii]
MPSSFSSIPLDNIDELNELWESDKRLPTLSSRREWAAARNLPPTVVNAWWWTKRRNARDRGLPLACENYHLPVGNPPETALIKVEPVDEDKDLTALNPSRCSSPITDTLSDYSELSFHLLSSDSSRHSSPRTLLPPSSDQGSSENVDICGNAEKENYVHQDYPSGNLRLAPYISQSHQKPSASILEGPAEDDEVIVVGSSASNGKTFTPNGFYLGRTTEPEEPDIHLVKTSGKPYEFPLLSKLSDSSYLPPLTGAESECIKLEDPYVLLSH